MRQIEFSVKLPYTSDKNLTILDNSLIEIRELISVYYAYYTTVTDNRYIVTIQYDSTLTNAAKLEFIFESIAERYEQQESNKGCSSLLLLVLIIILSFIITGLVSTAWSAKHNKHGTHYYQR